MTPNQNNRSSRQRFPRRNQAPQQSRGATDNPALWQRKYDEYRNLAENADRSDQVTRENYWQHAEHYFRLMNGSAAINT